jgi:hypothetical protein
MTTLDQIIDLQITISDKAPSVPNFGMPMLAGYHTAWPELVKEYVDAGDMLLDGFVATDVLYKMAVALKAQTPCPSTFKVGRLATPFTQTVTLEMLTAVQGAKITGESNGVAISYTIPGSASLTSVATAVELLVEAVPGVSSTSSVAVITATAAPGALNSYYFDRNVKIKDTTADPGITADLAAINSIDSAWYGLAIDCNSEAIVTAAAVWAEANKKLFVAQTSDWDVVDAAVTTDLASDLKALTLTRTLGLYHRGIARQVDLVAAAMLAVGLSADPGSITWSFKPLAAVSVSGGVDKLLAGETSALNAKNFSSYETEAGLNVTLRTRTPSGRYTDTTHFADWLYSTIQIDAFVLIANAPKVPYTEAGLSAVKGSVEGSLAKGKKNPNPGLDPVFASIVTIPGVAQQSTTDRANRIVRGIDFEDRLSGALEGLIIRGRLSV